MPTCLKKRAQQVCKAKNYISRYQAFKVPVKLSYHELQARRTRQARLESDFFLNAVRKEGEEKGRGKKKCHEIDHAVSS